MAITALDTTCVAGPNRVISTVIDTDYSYCASITHPPQFSPYPIVTGTSGLFWLDMRRVYRGTPYIYDLRESQARHIATPTE